LPRTGATTRPVGAPTVALPPQARRTDARRSVTRHRSTSGSHQHVANFAAIADHRQYESGRQFRWNVFNRMNSNVRAPFGNGGFELFDEQALTTDLTEGRRQPLIATRRHCYQLDLQARMYTRELCLDELRLPERQTALARGDAQRSDGHSF
jgi:hypothetical protein